MIKPIVIGIVTLLAGYKLYQYAETAFASPASAMEKRVKKTGAVIKDDVLSLKAEDTNYHYQLTDSFSMDLLTNGGDVYEKWITDAYLSGIPLKEAKKLLSQYPDMNKCGAAGSQQAQNASQIFDIALAPYNKAVAHDLAKFLKSRKNSQYLMCVHIEGSHTSWKNGSVDGKRYKVVKPDTPAKMIYVDTVTPIDCNTAKPLKS